MYVEDQTLQRFIDGELSSAEAQAVQSMLDNDENLQRRHAAEQEFDELLYIGAKWEDDCKQHEQIATIMAALPAAAPARKATFSMAQIAVAAVLMIAIACSYGFAGSSSIGDIVPISLITICSVIIGSLLIFMARPLRRVEASLAARFLSWRLNVGQADVVMHRCAGIAIILGGAYLMFV